MSITLNPQLEADVLSRVSSGRFADPMEVLNEAMRLLDEHEKRVAYRVAINDALAEVERGEYIVDSPDLMKRLIMEADHEDSLGLPMSEDALP